MSPSSIPPTAFAADELTGGSRALLAVLGIISLVLGLYAVRHVLITLLALALLLGIFWIINGAAELFMALSRQASPGIPSTVGPPPGPPRSQGARDVRRHPCQ
jgi:uncharacterized membrane protein HdeD (DUF308 family)